MTGGGSRSFLSRTAACGWLVSEWYRVQHSLRLFGIRVLRGIVAPKAAKITGYWRKLYDEKFMKFIFAECGCGVKLRRMRLAGNVSYLGEIIMREDC